VRKNRTVRVVDITIAYTAHYVNYNSFLHVGSIHVNRGIIKKSPLQQRNGEVLIW